MFPSTEGKDKLLTYIKLTWYMVKMHILTEVEYRANFLLKIFAMLISDVGLIVMWVIFFKSFSSINGWNFQDTMTLFSLNLFIFSIFSLTAYGLLDLSKYIVEGNLDYFLALPKNVLWQISLNKISIESLSDFVLGIFLFFFTQAHSGGKFLIYLSISIIAALIIYNFTVIVFSLSFYFNNFEESSERWFWTMFGFMLYPQSFFVGWFKVITLTVIPLFFIIGLPVKILQQFTWHNLFYMLGFWFITFVLAILIFNRGLRRYESGNLINVKM